MPSRDDPDEELKQRMEREVEWLRSHIDWSTSPRPPLSSWFWPRARARHRRAFAAWYDAQLVAAGRPRPRDDEQDADELDDDPEVDALSMRLAELPGVRACGWSSTDDAVVEVLLDPWSEQEAEQVRSLCRPRTVRFVSELPAWVRDAGG